jgi:hypothetical protein
MGVDEPMVGEGKLSWPDPGAQPSISSSSYNVVDSGGGGDDDTRQWRCWLQGPSSSYVGKTWKQHWQEA